MPRKTDAERFEQFVDRNGPLSLYRGAPGPCHLWTGSYMGSRAGQFGEKYGQFRYESRPYYAHRFAYQQAHGPLEPIPLDDGTEAQPVIDHRCRRRNCVNADHLEAVDNRTNVLRGTGPAAINARKTTCANGHDLTDPTNVADHHGARRCRTCHREAERARRARKAAARLTPQPAPVTHLDLTPRTDTHKIRSAA